MSGYRVQRTRSADKALAKIPARDRLRIEAAVALLAETPRPPRAVTLAGSSDDWRVRVGDYRIVYRVRDDELLILIITIGHRREVYR